MLKLDGVSKVYRVGAFGGRALTAVSGVGFEVGEGEVVSLIGESGSGKSTIGRMVLRLTQVSGGTITLDGRDISSIRDRKEYYRQVQGVFQDPFSCFNPIFRADRVFALIKEQYFPGVGAREWRGRVEDALESVRLDPGNVLGKYPHQLSGGQLQRMLIARAVLLDIRLLVADEIISMLDASTRIDVLNLLADLRARGLGILFVTHDLSLGNYVSDRTVVLRDGRIAEMGPTPLVFGDPRHPYTRSLLAAVPRLHTKWTDAPVDGTADGTAEERAEDLPCAYHEAAQGSRTRPGLAEVADGHFVACSGCAGAAPEEKKMKERA
ncbi:ABC transporter ATP-binding protein [Microbispora triticiradicis]|uniref:ABC transporter ATP-binding protein n=1 Tax=Microbispora triticiradicis TaxID=2200763 RepID=A0ABX9LRA2_9ACTN|nr:ABC transporter ATP-binding protein [Microbispora triticiradicis]RGA06551.1 ABC transporter ATP-binding protein [Microbispora triticiradicis]